MRIVQQFLVVLSLAAVTLAAIRPIQSFKDQAKSLKLDFEASRPESFKFDHVNTPGYKTTRHRQSTGIPTATRAAFNDDNFFIIATYSRSASQVESTFIYNELTA